MNNKIKILVDINSSRLINYLIENNIKYNELENTNNKYILVINFKDYKKLSRRFPTKILKIYGIKGYKKLFENYKYLIVSFIISLFILNLLTKTIFKIEINIEDNILKEKIIKILKEKEILIYKRKKKFNELNNIKKEILEENNNLLEWIEIEEKGIKYIVNVTPKVESKLENNNNPCDIVAAKSGVIKYIAVYSGTKIKEKNEFVNKGEVIISRSIMKDDKLIKEVHSSGRVYAEVWYKVDVEVPLKYKEKYIYKTFNHYYIYLFNKKITILGKIEKGETISDEIVLEKPYLFFKLHKEKKNIYSYKEININKETAVKKAYEEVDNYFNKKLNNDESIVSKKILKKSIKSSKMYLEVFVKTYENIASVKEEKETLNESSNK